jgi:deoxyribose-phosphate aldolase
MNESYARIYSLLDITTLEGTDNRSRINRFVSGVLDIYHTTGWKPAALCVFPVFAIQVKDLLSGTGIKTACVAGAFPHGQLPLHMKADEVKFALDAGADEIDYVINRGRFLEDGAEYLFEEVAHIRQTCGNGPLLKVILETGELEKPENMKRAAAAAIKGGADFVKTSTGKAKESATIKSVEMLCEAVKEHFLKTGIKKGIKPAGGISEPEDAERYIQYIIRGTGPDWIHPDRLRFGASRLAAKLTGQHPASGVGY